MKSATGAVQMQIKMKNILWNNDDMMKLLTYLLILTVNLVSINAKVTLAHTVWSSTRSNFSQLMRFTASAGGLPLFAGTESRSENTLRVDLDLLGRRSLQQLQLCTFERITMS